MADEEAGTSKWLSTEGGIVIDDREDTATELITDSKAKPSIGDDAIGPHRAAKEFGTYNQAKRVETRGNAAKTI